MESELLANTIKCETFNENECNASECSEIDGNEPMKLTKSRNDLNGTEQMSSDNLNRTLNNSSYDKRLVESSINVEALTSSIIGKQIEQIKHHINDSNNELSVDNSKDLWSGGSVIEESVSDTDHERLITPVDLLVEETDGVKAKKDDAILPLNENNAINVLDGLEENVGNANVPERLEEDGVEDVEDNLPIYDAKFETDTFVLPSTREGRKRKISGTCAPVVEEAATTGDGSRKKACGDNLKTAYSHSITNSHNRDRTKVQCDRATGEQLTSPNEQRKYTRTVIPTKDNPPREFLRWVDEFRVWSNAERLLALDLLIEACHPTQVRHMRQVIEPQFQRDFISLLPRELALYVLAYLPPRDLLHAAQTCKSWRELADDNLLWREKCKEAKITLAKRDECNESPLEMVSPWKIAFLRQHNIEMNWRVRPLREFKVLKGHDDHVITCLQFCGNRIVSGSDDNTLKVWSAITGKCLRTLVGHTGGVWSSQMAGNTVISGSTDRTLKVWDADTGECSHTLYGHTSTVRCMHLYQRQVVSGSRDATLRVWDVDTGECLHVLVGHLAAVRCVQYNGRYVVSGAYDYMVKVWDPEREECLHTLQGHTNRVYSLQFDGVHVVSGSLDTSIRVWDVETGSSKHTLMGHQSLTSGMELRNNILVSGNADSTVKVWDILTGHCLQTLSGPNKHQSAVTCLQFNSRFVITSSDDGTVKLWDVRTGAFVRNLVALDSGGSGGVVWRIRVSDTKLVCAVGSRNGTEETKLLVLDFDEDSGHAVDVPTGKLIDYEDSTDVSEAPADLIDFGDDGLRL